MNSFFQRVIYVTVKCVRRMPFVIITIANVWRDMSVTEINSAHVSNSSSFVCFPYIHSVFVSFRRVFYTSEYLQPLKDPSICVFVYIALAYHTSWVAVVIQADRPKLVHYRIRCTNFRWCRVFFFQMIESENFRYLFRCFYRFYKSLLVKI